MKDKMAHKDPSDISHGSNSFPILLGCEFVRPTAPCGTAISIAKIFYWSIDPKNHEFV
jgi:hypothetical protein